MKYGFIPDDDCEKPMTNGDRIRQMTDEELAEKLLYASERHWDICPPRHSQRNRFCMAKDGCKYCWLDWLKKEAKDDAAD